MTERSPQDQDEETRDETVPAGTLAGVTGDEGPEATREPPREAGLEAAPAEIGRAHV